MIQLLDNYFCAALFAISTIVFVEILINFKRPLKLKIILLCILIGVDWYSIGNLYCYYTGYNRWIVELPGTMVTAATLSFLSILYLQKVKRYVVGFAIAMIVVQLLSFSYYSFVAHIDKSIDLGSLQGPNKLMFALRGFFTVFSMLIIIKLYKKILARYNADNIYHSELRQWSLWLIWNINPVWIANIFRISHLTNSNVCLLMKLIGYLGSVLCLLFRPKFLNKTSLKASLFDRSNKGALMEVSNQAFESVFLNNLYYINREASVEHLSSLLCTTPEALLNFINAKFGMGYSDLVNKNRVDYFVDLISSGKHNDLTVDALAQKAGFGTRQHLYKYFKKFHGGTPSDLIRAVNGQ
jgi:AraC-like DNA-binding protein